MKLKVVIIVLSVLIVAGAGTAVGIYADKQKDKETASLVDDAVSSAVSDVLATAKATTEEETTIEIATQAKATEDSTVSTTEKSTGTTAAKKQSTTTKKETTTKKKVTATKKKTPKSTNTTSGIPDRPKGGRFEAISSPDGYYWETNYTRDNMLEQIYVDEDGRHFYFKNGDQSTKRIYMD